MKIHNDFRDSLARGHLSLRDKKKNITGFDKVVVIFCGKAYPALLVWNKAGNVPDWYYRRPEDELCFDDVLYDIESIDKLVEEKNLLDYEKKTTSWKWYKRTKTSVRESLAKWLVGPLNFDTEWCIVNKLTSALVTAHRVVIDPCLKDYCFYRKFEPYSAYQELDMWVAGTLSYPQNFMVEIEDKYRVAQHGFDPKYGFRTRPKDTK